MSLWDNWWCKNSPLCRGRAYWNGGTWCKLPSLSASKFFCKVLTDEVALLLSMCTVQQLNMPCMCCSFSSQNTGNTAGTENLGRRELLHPVHGAAPASPELRNRSESFAREKQHLLESGRQNFLKKEKIQMMTERKRRRKIESHIE